MAISFDSPVATHKVTHIPTGDQYLFCVIGDLYRWKKLTGCWRKDISRGFSYYIKDDDWVVKEVNKFKGNV